MIAIAGEIAWSHGRRADQTLLRGFVPRSRFLSHPTRLFHQTGFIFRTFDSSGELFTDWAAHTGKERIRLIRLFSVDIIEIKR